MLFVLLWRRLWRTETIRIASTHRTYSTQQVACLDCGSIFDRRDGVEGYGVRCTSCGSYNLSEHKGEARTALDPFDEEETYDEDW